MNPKSVETEGFKHVIPLEPSGSTVDIAAHEREDVADVKSLGGRIRKHHEVEIGFGRAGEIHRVGASLLPALTPFLLDHLGVVCLSVVRCRVHGRG